MILFLFCKNATVNYTIFNFFNFTRTNFSGNVACTDRTEWIVSVGIVSAPVCLTESVLFALWEVRRHAWCALHCLTVVFSRCHCTGVLWHREGIMCTGPSWEEKRAELLHPGLCHSRLPRHLIVRKVSTEPSGPCGFTASLSAGQTERHSVLGPGSFFPFSQRLCLVRQKSKKRKCQIKSMSQKFKVYTGLDVAVLVRLKMMSGWNIT